jgi:hypothetical protein
MKSALDCIPCFGAQVLNVARLTTDDPRVHERIPRKALRRAANVIDFGIKADLTAAQIPAALESSFTGPFDGDVGRFFAAAAGKAELRK